MYFIVHIVTIAAGDDRVYMRHDWSHARAIRQRYYGSRALGKVSEDKQSTVNVTRGWRHFTWKRLLVFILMVAIVASIIYCAFSRDSPGTWSELVEVVREVWRRLSHN